MAGLAPAGAFAADEIQGFPKSFPGRSLSKGVSLADLDRDGKLEIVTVAGEGFVVLNGDGSVWSGYPKVLKQPTDKAKNNFDNAPTLCDVDGDARVDVVLAGSNRHLYAVRADGSPLSGFPVKLDAEPKGAVACSPVRGSKAHDLVLVTSSGALTRVSYRGGSAQRIAKIGDGAESGVAVSDFDGDGRMDFVAVGGDARVYVVSADGKIDSKVDYRMAYRVSGTPSLGDINDDGRTDIVLASQDFKVHAIGLDGKPLSGFPVATSYRLYGGPALADIDRDGVLDVVFGSGDKKVYAVNGQGKSLKGFPVKVESRVSAEVAVGDVDFDGKPEIAVATERGRLHVLDARGKALRGFPRQLGGAKTVTAPALGDIDGDGAPELVVQDGGGNVRAYRFNKRGKAERAVVDWAMSGHDPSGTGRFGPNPGRYKDLSFESEAVFTTDSITAKYTFFDLDGDPEGRARIRWYKNGERVSDLDDKQSVPPASTLKHEKWKYTVQADENFRAYGESGTLSRVFTSPVVKIKNTPPTRPTVSLGPQGARTKDPLTVAMSSASVDVDGDRIQYRYAWIRDGAPVKTLQGKTGVPATQTKKGEVWRVVVSPFDGEEEGPSDNALMTILNTVPSAPVVAWSIASPKVDDQVKVLIKTPAVDVDGDPVTYRYRYRVGAETLPLPVSSAAVPPRTLHKHDELEVMVTAWDDEGAGGQITSTLKVVNTPPVPPLHAIWPANPKTTDPLVVGVREQAADADRDPITLDYQWFLDGKPVQQPAIVPASATRKGQKWTVRVTPRDDEVAGRPVEATTVIANSEPVAPVVVLQRYTFRTTDRVEPRIQKAATDADGDAVTLRYQWLRNGKPVAIASNVSALPATSTRKGERWSVAITPGDGTVDGKPARLNFQIENTPPTAPKVSLSSVEPSVRDAVTVKIDAPSTDVDGDSLTYRYRWYRNGQPVKGWAASKNVLKPFDGKKGEQWRVEVVAFDGQTESDASRAELAVKNHPPDPPSVAIAGGAPMVTKLAAAGSPPSRKPLQTTDDLECTITKNAVDPDKDTLTYRFRWYRGETLVPTSAELNVLPSSMTVEGESWSCEAEAFDGAASSSAVRTAPVSLANAGPGAPKVSVFPKGAKTSDDLVCELEKPANDPDYERLTYSYNWKRNGKVVPALSVSNTVAAKETKRGQRWQCEVMASDGQVAGPAAAAETVIENTAPSLPVVEVSSPAFAGEDLSCKVRTASTDMDGDAVVYQYKWYKDGVAQSFAASSQKVPGRLVRSKDLWKCEVIATDRSTPARAVLSPDVLVEPPRKVIKRKETRGDKRRRRRRR